ncbi:MAG: tetratricopeptide repeat protein [Desulfobacterales bacterium]|nr:tetratricopeptide repeat protein [Desulfobacterales bacterium]
MVFLIPGCTGGRAVSEPPVHLQAGRQDATRGAELYQKGCYSRALEFFLIAHRKFSASDQLAGVAMCLNNIGTTYRALGHAETAALFFHEAHTLYRRLDDRAAAAQALCNRAAALIDMGRMDEAEAALDAAGSQLPAGRLPAYLLKTRGVLMMKKGVYAEAEALLQAALDRTKPENAAALGATRSAMGALMQQTGRPEAAVRFYRAALEADRTAGFYKGIADDLVALSGLAETMDETVALLKRSIQIYALMDDRERVAEIMGRLEAAAEKGAVDIDLTRHFVKTWLDDPSGWTPCR